MPKKKQPDEKLPPDEAERARRSAKAHAEDAA